MRILFFSHYFPPEVNAPATRTYEHCARWAKEGHDVTVITCAPNCPDGKVFDGYCNRLKRQVEMVDGMRIVRVWTYLAPNAGTARRILNYLSFFLSSVIASLRLERPDVVVATSPQFFCGWAGAWAARFARVPFVLEIRDLWPESIAAVDAIRNRPLMGYLELLERRLYQSCARLVTVGDGYRARILEKADVGDRIDVVTNGVDLQRFRDTTPDEAFLRDHGLTGKRVCSYVGTIGMAHGLEVVVEAAQILKDRGRTDIAFCLVGDGAQRERLEQLVVERAVEPWVRFAGRQPSARIPGILAGSAACLVHLKDCELFETVIPSKIFEAMAMGRPIILGVRGDAREIVGRAQAGLEMEPGSAASLVSCVSRLADEPGLVSELGAKGRDFVDKYYNRDRLAREMLGVIEQAVDARLSACASGAGTGTGAGAGAPHSHRGGTLQ